MCGENTQIQRPDLGGPIGRASRLRVAASPLRARLQGLPPPAPVNARNFQMTWHHRNEADSGLLWLKGLIRETLAERRAELGV